MASRSEFYQYSLEILRSEASGDWKPLANVALEVDFFHPLQCARFAASRREAEAALTFETDRFSVRPRWDSRLGEPYVQAMDVIDSTDSSRGGELEIPITYFAEQARAAAAKLVDAGRLQTGDEYSYRVNAFRRQLPSAAQRPADPFSVEDETAPLVLPTRDAQEFLARATPSGEMDRDDMLAFIPQSIVDEAVELMRGAGSAETGGILIGNIYRDPTISDLYAVVTAQIPAHHAQQELTRLTFTRETWTAVDAAVRLRGQGEIYLGWWHTHPARQWCKDCPLESRLKCKLSGEFFSDHDVALHRCVFPRAYSIALVISDSYANGLTWPLFGWRQGMVQMRGFHLLDAVAVEAAAAAS